VRRSFLHTQPPPLRSVFQTAVPAIHAHADPDLTAATFSGVESSTSHSPSPLTTSRSTRRDRFPIRIVNADGKQQIATISEDKPGSRHLHFLRACRGNATLSIAYTGILNNELRGFYLSKTARRNYAVTHSNPPTRAVPFRRLTSRLQSDL